MIDEKKLEKWEAMVFKNAPQTSPPPTQWEIMRECFDTLSLALKAVRASQQLFVTRPKGWNTDGIDELREALAPFNVVPDVPEEKK